MSGRQHPLKHFDLIRPHRISRRRQTKRTWHGRIEALENRVLLAADPIINEFVASNNESLLDGNGNASDWIELFNAGDETADLGGYYLTDDAGDLARWQIPAGTQLAAGQFLTVFASGENAVDPDGNLHTNFRLRADGEYLGLAAPDATIISAFGDRDAGYPKQFTDISYGLGEAIREDRLIGATTDAQVLIPDSDGLGTSWTRADFEVDAAWIEGKNGVGYDAVAGQERSPGGTTILRLDFNDDDTGEAGAANTEQGWQAFHLNENGSSYDGVRVSISALGGVPIDDRDRSTPVDNPPALTYDQLFDDFIFARSQTDGTGMEVLIEGLTPGREYEVTIWSHDTGSSGARVSDWSARSGDASVAIESTYQFDGRDAPSSDFDNTFAALLTSSDDGQLRIQGVRNGGTSFGVFLNALQIVAPSASHLIQTNVQAEMHGEQTSAFVRLPFRVPAGISYDNLTLDMQYDAGFVAYLNGQEIARRNVSGPPGTTPTFDAVAQNERSLDATIQPEAIDVSSFADSISAGDNVLAIHALNSSAGDDDLLVRAELRAAESSVATPVYFQMPTPGEINAGEFHQGFVGDTTFNVDRGFFTEPFDVVISSATPGASLVYTTDGSEPSTTNGTFVHAADDNASPEAILTIETTSYVRAMAFKDGFLSSNVDTQTYIFLDHVLQQDPLANPNGPTYPDRWQANAQADYEMDPEIVAAWDDNNPENDDTGIRDALTSIPTMSIVMDHDDLWSGGAAIYTRSDQRGERFRRPASVEYFDPRSGQEFQINAGVQIHGGASRDNVRLKKHSFRLLFREDFGPTELKYPLFADTDNDEFNTLVLRAFFTDAFATRTITDRYNPIESQYLRDVWMKDTQLAMGNLSAHNTYVHLYINGLYWGLYNPAERPDEAFLAQYLGGVREDWDVIKDFNELFAGSRDAWNEMFSLTRELASSNNPDAIYHQLQGNDPDGSPNPDYPVYLDMDNLIDYMALHFYAVVEDWPHHNWYAGRNRVDPGSGFKFFVWDQEIGLDPRFRDRTGVSDRFTPAELYNSLHKNSPAFRLHFADRMQKHLFNDGALTDEASQARWMTRADEIEKAIIGESARWGDAREGERHRLETGSPTVTIPVMTVDLWREERDRVHDIYIPRVRELLLERLHAIGLVSDVIAPQLSQHGGPVPSGFELSLQAPQDPLLVETAILAEFAPVTVFVPRDGSLDAVDENSAPVWTTRTFDDTQWISGLGGVGFEERSGYEALIGIDLLALPADRGIDGDGDGSADATSFYARFPFDLPADFDSTSFGRLTVKAKYDDGFAAYLNGQLVTSQNAPDTLVWDERATGLHEAEINAFEEFDISEHLSLLVPGQTNVLAIHGLNRSISSNDLIISPELSVGSFLDVGEGPVYYTTDGTDPRLPNGEINAGSATLYERPLTLDETTLVRARSLVQGIWSAVTEAAFIVNPAGSGNLAISEINFNPHAPTAAELQLTPSADNDDFEFIELMNLSATDSIGLLGAQLIDGVTLTFPDVSLMPGERAVVVGNRAAFEMRYGPEINVVGEWTGSLANGGERLTVTDTTGVTLLDMRYNDSGIWPDRADGVGGTLELIDPLATPSDEYSKHYRWRGSAEYGGSPGTAGRGSPAVVINEVLSRTETPLATGDALELLNMSDQAIDVSGWFLSDSRDNLLKFQIPANSVLGPGAYLVFDETDFNPNPQDPAANHFALDGTGGDDVWLVISNADGGVSTFVDDVHFGAAINGESLGRIPNGIGRLAPMTSQTLGTENSSPRVGPLIISELNYNPGAPSDEALAIHANLTSSDLEFVEIHNPTAATVDMMGWRLRGGIQFDFAANSIDPAQTIVVLAFNPHTVDNANRLAAFRLHYGIDDAVHLVGGYAGQLANDGERIQLQRPDARSPDEPDSIPYVLEDELVFDDRPPWPASADGTGTTLHRSAVDSYGNSPASWTASIATPGVAVFDTPSADFNDDGLINIDDLDLLCAGTRTGDARFDLNADNSVDTTDVRFMVSNVLRTVIGDTDLDGRFNSSDLVRVFQAGEYEDTTPGNSRWSEGDWNCDGDFGSSDLVAAFQAGTYTAATPRSIAAEGVAAALNHTQHKPSTPINHATKAKSSSPISNVRVRLEAAAVDARELLFAEWDHDHEPRPSMADPSDMIADDLFDEFPDMWGI